MAILSIQSHVAYGHVGNDAAVFPLQRLGREVWPVHTVQFSNHTGYGAWTGDIFGADRLAALWAGLKARANLGDCEAVLSGYLGSGEIGAFVLDAVRDVKAVRPAAVYCCDPVMGDYGRDFFVAEDVARFITRTAVATADIVTPNQFEAEAISGRRIASLRDAKLACDAIRAQGPAIVLVTSFMPEGQGAESISFFLATGEGFRVLTTPRLPVDPPLNGAGDLTAALFLAHYLELGDPVRALELCADSVFAVFERSYAAKARELCLVSSQEELAHPRGRFAARRV